MTLTKRLALIGAALFFPSTAAFAAPGLDGEVYGATVEPGEIEVESRFGVLVGGADAGENAVRLELGYGVSGHTRLSVAAEIEKEPGQARKLEAVGFEVVQNIARLGPIDVALYGEYEAVRGGSDAVETKLLLQYRGREWDLRLNLIAEKELVSGTKVELGYAASADYPVADGLRLGLAAFGNLGTFSRFLPYDEHFIGPNFKFRASAFNAPLKLETGYLFPLGAAKADAKGMFRLNLELEF
ncbi:MAG: hypothetical protein ACKOPQ_14010 [Novosphingobium sp.]